MKAAVINEYGGPEVFKIVDIDKPELSANQILVNVKAAGVNAFDYKLRAGYMKEAMPLQFPAILGIEIAGTIEAVGSEVTDLAVGDEVVGWADSGAYADYAVSTKLAKKPADLAWDSAVALPVASETAERVLTELGIKSGETILINGASGAVGTIATQLAIQRGATVIGTASQANQDLIESYGATPIVYGEGMVERVQAAAPTGIDAVFDVAGKGALPDLIKLRGSTDRLITIADPDAQKYGVPFSGQSAANFYADTFPNIVALAAEGRLKTEISKTYNLDQVAEAHAFSEQGHPRGKIVLHIS